MTTREEVRNRIKDALKAAEDLRATEPSRELSLIITKLEEADLWAGARFLKLDEPIMPAAGGGPETNS